MSKSTLLMACAGVTCVLGSAAFAQTGEVCVDAIPVVAGSTPFDSTGYRTDGSASCAPSSADIWFVYFPTADGLLTIDTFGSTFDTVLSTSSDCVTQTACNDDSGGRQSRVAISVRQNVPVNIRVASYNVGNGGVGVLNISLGQVVAWSEDTDGGGDAGDIISGFQTCTGPNQLQAIVGSLTTDEDVDAYLIDVCDPAAFSATTFRGNLFDVDTRLFLFDSNGLGVTFDEDIPNGFPGEVTFSSRISGTFVPAPGNYYLVITSYDVTPIDADGSVLWLEEPYDIERAPDGPGAASPIAGWQSFNAFDTGTYEISLTGACFVTNTGPVCEPDVNQDGVADQGDVDYLVNVIAGGGNPTGVDADFNQDGVADQGDVDALVNVVAGGPCP